MKRLVVLLALLALVAAACGGDDAASGDDCSTGVTDGDLNLYNWTEYIPVGSLAEDAEVKDLVAGFEEEFGVNVVLTEYDSNETMLAQIDAGVAYDVVVPSDYMVSIMKDGDLLVKLNQAAIPNMTNVDDLFTDAAYDPGNEYSAPYQWGTTGIGYAYGSIDDEEGVSWAVIFDQEVAQPNAGFISLLDDERETMGSALIYLGYSLNTTSEEEVDQAAALIAETKEWIATFNSSGYWTDLTNGETNVAQGWNGDFLAEYDEISEYDDEGNLVYDAYEDFGYAIPVEGSAAWVDTMAIPTTAEHPCTAHAFVNYMLDATNGAELTNYNYYASPNAAATDFIYPEILEDPSIYPPPETMVMLEFFEDLGDFNNYYAEAFSSAKG